MRQTRIQEVCLAKDVAGREALSPAMPTDVSPDVFYVLVELPAPQPNGECGEEDRGRHAPRFLVLRSDEVKALLEGNDSAYMAKHPGWDGIGVPQASLDDVRGSEDRWDKIVSRVKQS